MELYSLSSLPKAGDTPGDFIRRFSPAVPGAAIAFFADRRDWRIKSPISGMSDIGDSPSVPVPAIFYGHYCESPVKSTNQVGRFYHMTFQNAPR